MYSLAWPDMFSGTKVNILQDKEAAVNNLKLVLGSCKNELLGDPAFGTDLKELFFSTTTAWLYDLVVDTIYETIRAYIPQIIVKREDIEISKSLTTLYITIRFRYIIDKELDTINIELIEQ